MHPSLDEIRKAQAADPNNSLRPVILLLRDHSSLQQYPEDTHVLLSQWDLLLHYEDVLYRRFYYPDGTTNFLQII